MLCAIWLKHLMHFSFRYNSPCALVRENTAIAATIVTPALLGNEIQGPDGKVLRSLIELIR